MRNKILAFFLILPIMVLGVIIFNLQRVRAGKIVSVAAVGFDPRDMLSGRYVYLRLDWDKTDCAQFPQRICPKGVFTPTYRYYLPEVDADKAQKLLDKENPPMALDFFYTPDEKPMLKNWRINGKPWQEVLNQL